MFNKAFLFYLGQFLSSMGSLAFNLCLVAFMPQAGFDLGQISLILGLQRFIPVFILGVWGHLADQFSAKKTVVVLEVLAGIVSLLLLWTWNETQTNYILFLGLCVFRAVLVNFQTGSRVKISKLLSDGSYDSNAKHAIWQMKASQGATLFAGLIGLVLIQYLSLKVAILIDLATFLVNGLIVYFMPDEEKINQSNQGNISWSTKFKEHFIFNKRAAILDIGLAVSVGGLISFFARVAGDSAVWNALFLTSYGLSVWIAGFMERSFAKKFSSIPFWFVLGGSFLLLGQIAGPTVETLIVMFIKDISYWVILHRISGHIQADTPVSAIGAVSSARFAIMVIILSVGEILVGVWSKIIPIETETLLRAAVAISIGIGLVVLSSTKKIGVLSDRPAL